VSDSDPPDFGRLLRPHIETVAEPARPRFLARLERGAAERYRIWAAEAAAEAVAAGLLACARREEEIAERVERRFPADAAQQQQIEAALPGARDAYIAVFENLPLREQLRIQANAERQGAAAWRALAAGNSAARLRDELHACAGLEEESALFLEKLLDDPSFTG
jgi:hypothetical protein